MTDKPNYNKMEKKEARRDGVSTVKNSGRGFQKGDAKSSKFLIDYKFNATSFQLTFPNWSKLEKDAWKEGQRSPLICVKFANGRKLAIIDWETIKEAGLLDDE